MAQVEKKIEELEGDEDEEGLLDGKELSEPFKRALEEIFARFDLDKDGSWNLKELDAYIFKTNGSHAPPQVLRQMIRNYPSTSSGNLKLEGCLCGSFLTLLT